MERITLLRKRINSKAPRHRTYLADWYQVVLNILVITDWLPNTGISLPFFSYGGSSLIMLLAQMGIVLHLKNSKY